MLDKTKSTEAIRYGKLFFKNDPRDVNNAKVIQIGISTPFRYKKGNEWQWGEDTHYIDVWDNGNGIAEMIDKIPLQTEIILLGTDKPVSIYDGFPSDDKDKIKKAIADIKQKYQIDLWRYHGNCKFNARKIFTINAHNLGEKDNSSPKNDSKGQPKNDTPNNTNVPHSDNNEVDDGEFQW